MEVEELTCPPTAAVIELLTETVGITPPRLRCPAHFHHFGLLRTIVGVDNDFVRIDN